VEAVIPLELSSSEEDIGPSDEPQALVGDMADCIVVEY